MIIDAATLDRKHTYKLMIGCIIPRSIGWVSTISTRGIGNLAPISFFTGAGPSPPTLYLGMQPKSDGVTLKDSFVNIRDTGEYCVNIATLEQAHQMHQSAFEFPPETDEFDKVGLKKAPCLAIKAPRVAECPISMECRLRQIIRLNDIPDHIILGEVLHFHVRDDLYLERGRIDTAAIHSVGRLAAEYTLAENAFITPLEEEVLDGRADTRMHRLDAHPDGWSPIDTNVWSPSGSLQHLGEPI